MAFKLRGCELTYYVGTVTLPVTGEKTFFLFLLTLTNDCYHIVTASSEINEQEDPFITVSCL